MSPAARPRAPFFSQFGEDEILERIFERAAPGTCVEVGAHDGVTGSNTYHFELLGWHCLLVEPVPALAEAIRRRRRAWVFECAASSAEGRATLYVAEGAESLSTLVPGAAHAEAVRAFGARMVPIEVATRRLDDLLDEAGVGQLDFVTIDVEGHELEVLRGFSIERFQPCVVVVEDNSATGDPDLRRHLEERGYRYFLRSMVNRWYAREDVLPALPIEALLRIVRRRAREVALAVRLRPLTRFLPVRLRERALGLIRWLLSMARSRERRGDP
ncbi:MAG: FkbM family methyltransferase [Thermoanaerobaculia bacterium]|nr:MAG: FkbM family methyltransferase [Thermoanaerobaculia bacterium]